MFDPLFDGLAWLLDLFYQLVPSYAIAIALLTLAVMVLTFPLTAKSTRSMAAMAKLQPELQKIRQRYPDDRQKQSEESFALMKEHGTTPFGGCLPLLVQAPVFFIMYQLIYNLTRKGAEGNFDPKYLSDTSTLREALETSGGEMMSFGMDLAKTASQAVQADFVAGIPFLVLIVLVVGTAYFQQYQVSRRNPQTSAADNPYAQQMQRMMKIMPLMYLMFGFTVPAGVVVYLLVSNVFRIGQQWLLYRLDPSLRIPTGAKVIEGKAETKPPAAADDTKPKPTPRPSTPKSGGGPRRNGPAGRAPGRAQPRKSKKRR